MSLDTLKLRCGCGYRQEQEIMNLIDEDGYEMTEFEYIEKELRPYYKIKQKLDKDKSLSYDFSKLNIKNLEQKVRNYERWRNISRAQYNPSGNATLARAKHDSFLEHFLYFIVADCGESYAVSWTKSYIKLLNKARAERKYLSVTPNYCILITNYDTKYNSYPFNYMPKREKGTFPRFEL